MFFPKKKRKVSYFKKAGFTLVEIMVSVAIFSMVVTMGMASLLSVMDAYRYAEKKKKVYDALDYVVENMTRELRLGEHYYYGSNGYHSGEVHDGSGLIEGDGPIIGFDASDNRGYMIYYLKENELYRADYDENGNPVNRKLTSRDQVVIKSVRMAVMHTDPDDSKQPLAWFQIKGYPPQDDESQFIVQSLVSQRVLDVE